MRTSKKRYFLSFERYKRSFLGLKSDKKRRKLRFLRYKENSYNKNKTITNRLDGISDRYVLYKNYHLEDTQRLDNRDEDTLKADTVESSLFVTPATLASIKRFPFFSGNTLSFRGDFHQSFRLQTPITELEFPSEFRAIADQRGLATLKDIMLRDHTEFVYYRKIDKNTIEHARRAIIDFILFSNQSEEIRHGDGYVLVKSPNELAKCSFFSGNTHIYVNSWKLKEVDLYRLDFTARFHNILRRYNLSFRKQVRSLEELLNTDPQNFLKLPNCGHKTIEDARTVVLDFLFDGGVLKERYFIKLHQDKLPPAEEVLRLPEEITKCNFFSGNSAIYVESPRLKAVDVYGLDFSIRFYNALKTLEHAHTLEDLLNTKPQHFLRIRNCGRKTIADAKRVIRDFLSVPGHLGESYSIETHDGVVEEPIGVEEPFLDLRLVKRLGRVLRSERSLRIFLLRYGYDDGVELTLEEIGEKFGLTRERIRQILEGARRRIIRIKYTLEDVTSFAKKLDYVMALTSFVSKLKDHGVWGQTNANFLIKLLIEFLGKRYGLILDNGYLINLEIEGIEKSLGTINSAVVKHCKSLKDGIHIDDLLAILENEVTFQDIDTNRLVTRDTIVYLSKKLGCFYVCENLVCDEMTYQIREGKYLKNVVYYSLKYLREPIHFSVLAEFIRAHNKKYRDVEDIVVHATLVRMDYCHDVDRGVYALKEWKIPKHISAGDALIKLLQERGPMLEDDIIETLSQKYTLWNIKMALENNKHKLIKIGNNLLNLKEEVYESN